MTSKDQSADKLDTALHRLETNLETPVVPGELSSWLRNLRESWQLVGRLLPLAVRESHEARFQQISEQDPELLPRVQQLREEDQHLLDDFAAVSQQISELGQHQADRLENQPHIDERIDRVVKLGLALVIRARTQETALSTWYMEAFQRDRGIGD